jgi:Mrp family chromosome partitioning ATPase
MGKTFEALQRAEKEQHREVFQPVPYRQKAVQPFPNADVITQIAPAWCKELWSKCKLGSQKTILVTGVSPGNGCTTTIGYYAAYLASELSIKVLVLDLNSVDPSGAKRFFLQQDKPALTEMFTPRAIQNVKTFESLKRNLVVVTSDGERFDEVSKWVGSGQFSEFLTKAAEQFDLVLLDSAPISQSMETRILCSKVDGVILMVESGKSRRAIAMKVKKDLEDAGAKLLGAVVSKRRYYIPDWLYTRL